MMGNKEAAPHGQTTELRNQLKEFVKDVSQKVVEDKTGKTEALQDLLEKVRAGQYIPNHLIPQIAHNFSEDLTLDNLPTEKLTLLCRFMGLRPSSYRNLMAYRIARRLEALKKDDAAIAKEGISRLTLDELKTACKERGMRTVGVGVGVMRKQLHDWLDLSLVHSIQPLLLILSRAFTADANVEGLQSIQKSLELMDEKVFNSVVGSLSQKSQEKLEYLQKETEKLEAVEQLLNAMTDEDFKAISSLKKGEMMLNINNKPEELELTPSPKSDDNQLRMTAAMKGKDDPSRREIM